jgi:undecaprenyl-diphosphatase
MDFFYRIDVFLFKLINQQFANSVFDQIMPFVTDLHHYRWFSIAAVSLLLSSFIYKHKKTGLVYFLFLILSVSVSDFAGGKIKRIANRPRPFQNIETNAIQRSPASQNTSFYSNHASNNVAAAAFLTMAFPAGKIIFICIAVLVSYSRIYNGVHYPADVLCGALMGLLWGWIFFLILKKTMLYFKKVDL